jgi:6-phosphogluconolactonase
VAENAARAAELTAERMALAIAEAKAEGRTAHISLAGGNTPRPAYARLVELVPLDDWAGVELWLGDERMVPWNDPESNYLLAEETLGISGAPIHVVNTSGTAEEAAAGYSELLAERVPAGPDGLPMLDLNVLGMGPDGHTASLFPNHPGLDEEGLVIAVHDSPKPPPDRVSFSLPLLKAARANLMLVTGKDKADAVAKALAAPDPSVPASLVADGNLTLILDAPAAPNH